MKKQAGSLHQAISSQNRLDLVASETGSFWLPGWKQDKLGSFVVASSAGELRRVPGTATPVSCTLLAASPPTALVQACTHSPSEPLRIVRLQRELQRAGEPLLSPGSAKSFLPRQSVTTETRVLPCTTSPCRLNHDMHTPTCHIDSPATHENMRS